MTDTPALTEKTLGDLLTLAASSSDWGRELWAVTCNGNLPGASLGPALLISPATETSDVERDLVRRVAAGGVSAMVRIRNTVRRDWSPYVRVELSEHVANIYRAEASTPAAAASTPAGPASPASAPPTELETLKAHLASMQAQLDEARKPTTTSVVASDPFSVAMQMQQMSNQSFERAIAMMSTMQKQAAPAPVPTQQGADFDWGMKLGAKMASLEAKASSGGGIDWGTVLVAASPLVERFLGVLDKNADAKLTAKDVELARIVAADPKRAALTLVPEPSAEAGDDVVADVVENGAAE